MILDATTKSLTIVLGEAKTTTDCDITASWADNTPDQFLPGNNTLVSNGTSSVTVVPAPAFAGIERQVQEVTLYNNDTVNHTVYLREHDGSNTRVITSATLVPNASFRWPLASVPTGGTVTEIDTDFGITGGPITTSGTLRSTGSLLNTQSGDYTVTNADIGKYIVMTKSTAATLTLTAASLRTGWWAIVTQALTGTTAANKLLTYTPTTGTFDGGAAGYDYPGAQRLIEFDGTNFNSVLLRGGTLEVKTSDSPYTSPVPTGATVHHFLTIGAGGGGGSGRRGAAGTARGGGTGGAGGGYRNIHIPASSVTNTLVFTVPAGATGGAAVSADNTDGNPGGAVSGLCSIQITGAANPFIQSGSGGSGAGGLAATALSGGAGGGQTAGGSGGTTQSAGGTPSMGTTDTTVGGQFGGSNGIVGSRGVAAAQGGAPGAGATNAGAVGLAGQTGSPGGSGGGAGGGISAANAASAGGNSGGGPGSEGGRTGGSAGTSGVAGGTGGSGSTTPSPVGRQAGGAGGGSGFDNTASGTASAAGPGGNGGIGSGGGGGGASLNGNNSGAGGSGGDGLARWWYA